MPKSPVLVFANVNRLPRTLFKVTGNAGGRTITHAQWDERHKAMCFRVSLEDLRKPLGAPHDQNTVGRDLAIGFGKALSMFHVVDVEFPESEHEAELTAELERVRAELAKARREVDRLTFELSQSPPVEKIAKADIWTAPAVSGEQSVFDDIAARQRAVISLYRGKDYDYFNDPKFTISTQANGEERAYRALRRIAIMTGMTAYDGLKKDPLIRAIIAHIANADAQPANAVSV